MCVLPVQGKCFMLSEESNLKINPSPDPSVIYTKGSETKIK